MKPSIAEAERYIMQHLSINALAAKVPYSWRMNPDLVQAIYDILNAEGRCGSIDQEYRGNICLLPKDHVLAHGFVNAKFPELSI